MRRVFICAAALLGLLSPACGESSGPSNEVVIEMQDGEDFFPATATVSAGTRVRWRNVDNVAHNTTSNPMGLWASGNLNPGGTFARTFDTPGTFNYTCTLHPGMNGTITVQ
jgi:plastocyanin